MNKREQVICAVQHKSPATVPYQLDLSSPVYDKLARHYGDPDFLYTIIGNHLTRAKHLKHQPIDAQTYRDLFGVVWSQQQEGGDIGCVMEYPLMDANLKSYVFPEPDAKLIKDKCERITQEHGDLFKIYEIGFSLFERAWTLRGMENVLMDFIENEAFINSLLDRIVDYNLKVIDIAAKYPIDCMMFGDDWGQQIGLIMGPQIWRKYIKPRISVMYERVKKHGLFVAQHSCGDNREIFADMIECGLDIYNTFQPEIYDVEKFKTEYGNDLTIYGGISTQCVLSQGSPEDVKNETRRMMAVLGRNGGYIAAPTHEIPSDIPLENILSFIETVKNQ